MVEPTYLTPEGAEVLRTELNDLLTIRRPELAKKLSEAVSMGDLKENADYHDAKEQQAFTEGRIQYLENILRTAIIAVNEESGIVGIGSAVTIVEDGSDEDEVYTIVGGAEASPAEGKISNESPIGRALIGHKKGDKVVAKTPGGDITFKIKKVK